MDPRTHVAHALVRLLATPGPLPARDTAAFRNRLLDETGGDFRPLVHFLLQLAEAGLVDDIEAAARRGERWEDTHRQLAVTWTAEHYTQPEMARWGVSAWGAALGRCAVPNDAPPPTAPAPRTSHAAHAPASPAPARSPARGGAPPRPSLPPSNLPAPAPRRGTASGAATLGGRRPYLNATERRALAAIGVTGAVAAALIAVMSPVDTGVESQTAPTRVAAAAPAASPTPAADAPSAAPPPSPKLAGADDRSTDGSTGGRPDAPPPRSTAPDSLADALRDAATAAGAPRDVHPGRPTSDDGAALRSSAIVAPARSEPDLSPELDALAISRYSAITGTARLGGIYRLTVNREGIYGDDRCATIGARIDWNQRTIDTIAVDVNAATFRFISRPTLAGRVAAGGVFFSRVIVTERDGTRSSFRLQGQLTPWGFQATGDTRTETMLRWRRTVRCQFVAALSGDRVR